MKGEAETRHTPCGRLRVTSLEAAAAAAAAIAGVGLAQAPEPLVFPALSSGALPGPPGPGANNDDGYPGNRYMSTKVRVFADFVADLFATERWWPPLAEHLGQACKPGPDARPSS